MNLVNKYIERINNFLYLNMKLSFNDFIGYIQFNGRNTVDIHEFCGERILEPVDETYMELITSEGFIKLEPNDYIIKDIYDNFYSCKPNNFKRFYKLLKKC